MKAHSGSNKCYVDGICTRCDFFDGTDDELECAAFKILRELVETNVISLKDVINADIDGKSAVS